MNLLNGGRSQYPPVRVNHSDLFKEQITARPDLIDVKGQETAKRALEVACAGGHNLLMIGPPGAGKTMLAKRIPSILPAMSFAEALKTTAIHSVCGLLKGNQPFLTHRPFRAPHHTISSAGLVGGSSIPRPGEVSLAHNGVLFLDELLEFHRSVLEVLRQPLEDGEITISRAARTLTFPAQFMLAAAMNPCPCGYWNSVLKECVCTPAQIQRYRSKISGPLLDRIDLHIDVPEVSYRALTRDHSGESSKLIARRVAKARDSSTSALSIRQALNLLQRPDGPRPDPQTLCVGRGHQEAPGKTPFKSSASRLERTTAFSRCRAPWPIWQGSRTISSEHVSEAIQYRSLDRNF